MNAIFVNQQRVCLKRKLSWESYLSFMQLLLQGAQALGRSCFPGPCFQSCHSSFCLNLQGSTNETLRHATGQPVPSLMISDISSALTSGQKSPMCPCPRFAPQLGAFITLLARRQPSVQGLMGKQAPNLPAYWCTYVEQHAGRNQLARFKAGGSPPPAVAVPALTGWH